MTPSQPVTLPRVGLTLLLLGALAGSARGIDVARVRQGATEWTIAPLVGSVQVGPFYSYGSPFASCANTGLERAGTSLLFFYDDPFVIGPSPSALALVIIQDAPENPAGGNVTFDLTGLPPSARYAVHDDPTDAYALDPPVAGRTRPTWIWASSDADGAALDGMGSEPFCLAIQPEFVAGIGTWQTLDGPSTTAPTPFTIPSLTDTVHVCVGCLALTCPAATATSCDGATAYASVRAAGASLCGTSTVTNDRTAGGADASDTYPMGRTDVTFTMVDSVGFASSCTTQVVVTSSPAPPAVTNCPAPLAIDCAGAADVPASDPVVQDWFAQFTATDDCMGISLTNDAPAAFPSGCRGSVTPVTFSATDSGGNVVTCSSSVTVRTECIAPPADVGDALRATGHGDPRAALVTATFDWSRDGGLPRRADEHYHVLRGLTPLSLAQVPGTEPWSSLTLSDATPAATSLPLVHCYVVLAAGPCEDVSSY